MLWYFSGSGAFIQLGAALIAFKQRGQVGPKLCYRMLVNRAVVNLF